MFERFLFADACHVDYYGTVATLTLRYFAMLTPCCDAYDRCRHFSPLFSFTPLLIIAIIICHMIRLISPPLMLRAAR